MLVLRGFELFGARQDGDHLSFKWSNFEKHYTDKVPRLSRVIFRCLSVPSAEPAVPQAQATEEANRLQDIGDTIYFTQPLTYDPYPYGPSVGDEHFETAAKRLLCMDDERSANRGKSRTLPKADLQRLIQLLLVLRPEDRRWKDGLYRHEYYQRSGDFQHAHLVPDLEEASRASGFATVYMPSQFKGDEESIHWDVFQAWCSDCVRLSWNDLPYNDTH